MSNAAIKLETLMRELVRQHPRLVAKIFLVADPQELKDASPAEATSHSLVAFPTSAEEVQLLINFARNNALAVIPRGARTGLSGGSVPISPSLIIDVSRMKRVQEFDPAARRLVVEPGVTLGEIEDLLDPLGFMYPPDPASYRVASIGGTVATNAGGLRCVKYGVTADWVQTLDVVLSTGELVTLGHPVIKDTTGYNLKNLFIGSEGTLGVITKIGITFCPKASESILTLVAFANITDAASAVISILETFTPSMCEILDAGALLTRDTSALTPLLGEVSGWGADPALLMLEVDGPAALQEATKLKEIISNTQVGFHHVQEHEMAAVLEVRRGSTPGRSALRNNSSDPTEVSAEALVERSTSFPMIAQDISVPITKLLDTIYLVREVATKFGLKTRIAAHAGDGNLHVFLSTQNAKSSAATSKHFKDDEASLETAMDEILSTVYEFGGATSGEHGIGLLKTKWARDDLGTTSINLHHKIKDALDPTGIMNPGKAF